MNELDGALTPMKLLEVEEWEVRQLIDRPYRLKQYSLLFAKMRQHQPTTEEMHAIAVWFCETRQQKLVWMKVYPAWDEFHIYVTLTVEED